MFNILQGPSAANGLEMISSKKVYMGNQFSLSIGKRVALEF